MKPWNPEHTAPRNKVVLAGWDEPGSVFPATRNDQGVWFVNIQGQHPDARCGMWFEIRPTHWMPMPKHPKPSAKKVGKKK